MTQPENDIQDVLNQLSVLEPGASERPSSASRALARVQQRIERRGRHSFTGRLRRNLMGNNRRYAFTTVLLVVLFGIAFSFPSVRAAASEFLGLFRVQKFAAISVSPDQLALLERVAEEGLVPGEFVMFSEPGELTPVSTISEASVRTGLTVRSLRGLGRPETIYISEGGSGRLTIDLEGSRAILEATGVDPYLLPDSLDGKAVDVAIYSGVQQQWPDGTILLQTHSPLVEYPVGLDPTLLGQALLQVLGMNEEEALRLAQSIDWTSTLLLPVPQEFASFNEVTVNGVSGLVIHSVDGQHGVIMWQKDGIIYLLNGTGDAGELVALADSLK